jgi:carboxylesterase type B
LIFPVSRIIQPYPEISGARNLFFSGWGFHCTLQNDNGPGALALSAKMGEAWAGFARTGKPGHGGLPLWPAYDEKTQATMMFHSPCAVQNDPEGDGLRLIRQMA